MTQEDGRWSTEQAHVIYRHHTYHPVPNATKHNSNTFSILVVFFSTKAPLIRRVKLCFHIRLSDTLERDFESLKGKEVLTIMLSICALRLYCAVNGFLGCAEKEVASATEDEDLISSWKDVDLWVMHLGCAEAD